MADVKKHNPANISTLTRQVGGGASENQRAITAPLKQHVQLHLKTIFREQYGQHGADAWNKDQIDAFIEGIQGETADTLSPQDPDSASKPHQLDYASFLDYMTSSASSVTAFPREQDMSWPLHSYFISSSHNTYLTGNQLYSDSSAEAYKNVLLRGCRCIEIDVWDGQSPGSDPDSDSVSSISSDEEGTASKRKGTEGKIRRMRDKLTLPLRNRLMRMSSTEIPTSAQQHHPPHHKEHHHEEDKKNGNAKGEAQVKETPQAQAEDAVPAAPSVPQETELTGPRVLHGYTLTKEVSFREVCQTVGEYAFAVTKTPLIVSLEVHCSPAQQEIMVQIMEEAWGKHLIPIPEADPTELPSPDKLEGKILVKVKYAPPAASGSADSIAESNGDSAAADGAKSKPSKITHALSRLGIYTRGVSFKSLSQPEAQMPNHIFSLAEKKVIDVHKEDSVGLFNHNRNFMMRAYPSGMRIRSDNLDPAPFWSKGIQIVALNWQRWDEGMMLNEGMFAGTHGYVLKPEGYRGDRGLKAAAKSMLPSESADSSSPAAMPDISQKVLDLHITVLAAQDLPLPPDDTKPDGFKPYVKVELHSERPDESIRNEGAEKEGEFKAHTKTKQGCDPDFEGETLSFDDVPGIVDELAFVRFTVRDDELGRDDLAAWACVRLDRLQSGFRMVHLSDCQGHLTNSFILVKISKTLT